jgi:hypothetical protein
VRGDRLVRWAERRFEHHGSGRFGSLLLGCLQRFAESSQNSVGALVWSDDNSGSTASLMPSWRYYRRLAELKTVLFKP